MPRIIKIGSLFLATAFVAAAVWFCWRAHVDHRSIPGHIVRFLRGEDEMTQHFNDLAEDITNTPAMAQLQPWVVQTLKRYREGRLETNGCAQYYWDEPPAVRLSRAERPEFINHEWGITNADGEEEPEVFIVLDANRQPEAVAIGWYMYGVQIGPPEYVLSYHSNYFCPYERVKPGIFVYGNYK
jgi:hypothetical protein